MWYAFLTLSILRISIINKVGVGRGGEGRETGDVLHLEHLSQCVLVSDSDTCRM